jgi:hypothetical protein
MMDKTTMEDYSERIDGCNRRGAINDMSVLAYIMLNKITALEQEISQLTSNTTMLYLKLSKQSKDSEELILYKQALTKAVSLPAGSLPRGHTRGLTYDSTMINGNVVVTKAIKSHE